MSERSFLCTLFALGVLAIASAQIDTPPIPPERDVRDLYRRVAASRFVVVGTVVESEGVTKRMTPEVTEKARTDLGAALGGSLYRIRVEDVVCRQSDLAPAVTGAAEVPQVLGIFVPRTFATFPDEVLLPQRRYLLFLVVPREQEAWIKTFQLDPAQTYYRTEEGYRGAIPLAQPAAGQPAPAEPPVLDKIRRLCQAMKPSKRADKLAALNKLAKSDDPVLRKEAAEAVSALEKLPR